MEQAPKSNNDQLGDEIDKVLEDHPTAYEIGNKNDSKEESVSNEPSVEIPKEAKEASDKKIDEHNEEIRERKESTEEKPKEKSENAEKPSPEVNFGNNPNLEDFKNLTGGIKEKIASVYEGMKVKFVDRANIMHNATLYAIQKEKVEELSKSVSIQDSKIENLQDGLKMHGERMEKLTKQFGELEPKAQKEADKEKRKLEKDLELAKQQKTELLLEGSRAEAQRNKYEKIKDQILEKVEKFVDEKTAPYNEKIEGLKDQRGQLDTEIGALAEKRNNSQSGLNELEEMAENAQFKFEKITYRNKIKEAKTELKELEYGINSLQRDQMKMDGKISGLYGKVNHWNGVRDKMVALSKGGESAKNEAYSAPKTPEKETVNTGSESENVKAWYEANQVNENAEQTIKGASNTKESSNQNRDAKKLEYSAGGTDESVLESQGLNFEESKGLEEISSEDYIKKWNHMFDRTLHVDKAVFLEILKKKNKYNSLSDILVVKKIEEIVGEYNNKLPEKKRIEWKALGRMFDRMREEEDLLEQAA